MRPLEHGRELEIVARGEAVELQVLAALDVRLALRDLVRRDPRSREHLHQVGSGEKLDRACVGDLVDAATHEQEARERPRGRMLDHLVDLQLPVPGARLEEEVVGQVFDEVAGGEHVVAVPGPSLGVLRQRTLAADQEVMWVAHVLEALERTARPAAVRRRCGRGAGEHRVDRLGDQLDVAELLGRDVRDQVVERPSALLVAEVERLKGVVQERRHLAELSTQELLDGGGPCRIRVGRRRQLGLNSINAANHGERSLSFEVKSGVCL